MTDNHEFYLQLALRRLESAKRNKKGEIFQLGELEALSRHIFTLEIGERTMTEEQFDFRGTETALEKLSEAAGGQWDHIVLDQREAKAIMAYIHNLMVDKKELMATLERNEEEEPKVSLSIWGSCPHCGQDANIVSHVLTHTTYVFDARTGIGERTAVDTKMEFHCGACSMPRKRLYLQEDSIIRLKIDDSVQYRERDVNEPVVVRKARWEDGPATAESKFENIKIHNNKIFNTPEEGIGKYVDD